MPERLEEITVKELSLVPKGAHPGTDFVPLAKEAEGEVTEPAPAEVSDEPLEKESAPETVEATIEDSVTPIGELTKEFADRIDELDDTQLSQVIDVVLAKAKYEDDEDDDEIEDPLEKRVDAMEKTLVGLTSALEKSAEALGRIEDSLKKEEPEPVQEPEVQQESPEMVALLGKMEAVFAKVASVEAASRETQARAKKALGEDPGEL